MSYYPEDRRVQRRQKRRNLFSGMKLRLMIGGAIILFSVLRFYSKGQPNPITGKTQRVDMSIDQEIRMGIQSAPQMGEESLDYNARRRVENIGSRLVTRLEQHLYSRKTPIRNPYSFDFHLLADQRQINAFALPGGQVFITEALYNRLDSDDKIAGVLGHEIGHVIERHGSERMAKGSLIQGIVGAAGVAGGSQSSAGAASYVGNLLQMKYGREDELESDVWGLRLMMLAGYDPEALLGVMDVLEKSSAGADRPEFLSTHPRPANRKEYIKKILDNLRKELQNSGVKIGERPRRQQREQPERQFDFDPNPNLDLD